MSKPNTNRRSITSQRLFCAALIMTATSWGIAQAQPRGGYQQSCQNTSVQGDTLRSSCKDHGGALRQTELQGFAQCVGEIFNDNGVLRCSKGAPPPAGGYTQSCEQTFVDGQTLRGNCRNRAGGLVAASLPNFRQCVGNIFNDDGALRCSMGGAPPPGGYTRTCEQTFVVDQNLVSKCRNIRGGLVTTTLPNFRQCVGDIFNAEGALLCSRGGLPPAGTYTATCNFSRMDGTTLVSTCKTVAGPLVRASLADVAACRSTIANIDGQLTCTKGTGPIPPGTYLNSCADIVVTPASITAFCRTHSGRGRTSNIANPATCRTPVENIDGFLACAKGNAAPPQGSYHDSCHDVVTNGTSLSASCGRNDGGYQQSTINLATCSGPISNQDGVLRCQNAVPAAPPPAPPAKMSICASANIPSGWIVYDIQSSPTHCNSTTNDTTNNVAFIVQYSTVAVNGSLNVCSSSPTPMNWVVTATSDSPTLCGFTGTHQKIKTITRVN